MARRTQKKPKTQEVLKDTTTQEVANSNKTQEVSSYTETQQEPKTQEVSKGSGTQEIQSENSVQDTPEIQDDFFLSAAQEKQQQFIDAIYSGEITIDQETNAILKNGKPLPYLDPNNPAFDAEQHAFYMQTLTAAVKDAKEDLAKLAMQIITPEAAASIVNTAKEAQKLIDSVMQSVKAFTESSIFKAIADSYKTSEQLQKEVQEVAEEWQRLQPYMEEVLQDPKYNGITLDELMNDPEHFEYDDILEEVFEAAKALKADKEKTGEKRVNIVNKEDYIQAVDKVNNRIWDILAKDSNTQIVGQIGITSVDLKGESSKDARNGIKRSIYYSISFSDLLVDDKDRPIMKKLTPFDKRVYSAIFNLYDAGNTVISTHSIYRYMGHSGKTPSKANREAILESIKKMMGAVITIDNAEEVAQIGRSKPYKYPKWGSRTENLLTVSFVENVYINGKLVPDAIQIFKTPVLFDFARERNQITTYNRVVLDVPLDQRDSTILLQDYLIEEIQRIRAGKRSNKILYSTIFEAVHVDPKNAKQVSRTKDKIIKCLEYWKTEQSKYFIYDYDAEKDKDGVYIYCSRAAAAKEKKKTKYREV